MAVNIVAKLATMNYIKPRKGLQRKSWVVVYISLRFRNGMHFPATFTLLLKRYKSLFEEINTCHFLSALDIRLLSYFLYRVLLSNSIWSLETGPNLSCSNIYGFSHSQSRTQGFDQKSWRLRLSWIYQI